MNFQISDVTGPNLKKQQVSSTIALKNHLSLLAPSAVNQSWAIGPVSAKVADKRLNKKLHKFII